MGDLLAVFAAKIVSIALYKRWSLKIALAWCLLPAPLSAEDVPLFTPTERIYEACGGFGDGSDVHLSTCFAYLVGVVDTANEANFLAQGLRLGHFNESTGEFHPRVVHQHCPPKALPVDLVRDIFLDYVENTLPDRDMDAPAAGTVLWALAKRYPCDG
ncbi:Rap1a/Tai family immunity protein [Paracoccus saliphilus]|uniref:Rap1a immunity protein domain-containing protein n=1 Tax=Paracoccus saliphilus TaxID=405559 RepID=A0AA45W4M8_9RHOB|nr:Rap1a/Tai family immunity protein [Paracoccus saliphilus]WCR04572.1 hypothetical protein JHX88_07595 [Paracoccus saliphilus]SIS86942.1 hypothetical protein SAMN05421772_10728 [Paracoccus saliphilus]